MSEISRHSATDLLKRAFEKAAAELPDYEQDDLAERLLKLLESDNDARWDALFAQSPDKLDRLAQRALEDWEAGRATPLDPEKL
jgi:hypothetical protein